jgi:hypothetical protein
MAERIVSPGVFTREKDLSFLPAGIAAIGACIIGPTLKGPAFVPTRITSFPDFEEMFGSVTKEYYTPYAIEQYLRSAGTVTVIRVLNTAGYSADYLSFRAGNRAVLTDAIDTTGVAESDAFSITVPTAAGGDNTAHQLTFVADANAVAALSNANNWGVAIDVASTDALKQAAVTDAINGTANAAVGYGTAAVGSVLTAGTLGITAAEGSSDTEITLTMDDVGTAGNVASVLAAVTGFEGGLLLESTFTGGTGTGNALAVLAPSRGGSDGTAELAGSSLAGSDTVGTTVLTLSGSNWGAKGLTSTSYTFGFNTGSSPTSTYIADVFAHDSAPDSSYGASAQTQKSGQDTVAAYLYKNFRSEQTTIGLTDSSAITLHSGSLGLATTYNNASTPYIQSQLVNKSRYNLFKVNTRSHGSDVNLKYKIAITNVKKAGTIAGTDFGSFSLEVRTTGLTTNWSGEDNPEESWHNLNFDPTSTNYFARRIGDRYVTIDSDGKLTYNGDWPNMSKHIYVSDFQAIADNAVPASMVPMGHAAIQNPYGSDDTNVPTWDFNTTQDTLGQPADNGLPMGVWNAATLYGHNYRNLDAKEYLAPVNSFGGGSHTSMSLEHMSGSAYAPSSITSTTYSDETEAVTLDLSHIKQRQFVVPFQGGFNSVNPAAPKYTKDNIVTTNTMGFDCSTTSTGGTVAYKKAINAISNPDEFDINMLVTPGIIHGLHNSVTNHAISKMEERGDAFYVLDCVKHGDTIATATAAITALDTNYAATYYPWVKIVDRNTALPVWVPPSVVLPGVIAYTDKVAHEWFAPAGLNRGGLTTVLEAQTRLTHDERDTLYEERVNPIASFPGQGVVVWGQKTLQARPSALDRVNVRRLLIKLKKFIASASRYLVFEQNSTATRNRFLNIVNPFLESVQSNAGLSAFRVVMDDTNNTPDVVDRNQLVGQIFIQPTRTAEFIVLDFVVLPTGATFPA